jgi:GxxExxY protein
MEDVVTHGQAYIACDEQLIEKVLGAAIRVHKELGPGLLESVYERALMVELNHQGIAAASQVAVPVTYRGQILGDGFRADIIVENQLLLELKSVNELSPIHMSQVITYLKLLKLKRGLILNFNKPILKQGIKRVSI